MAINVYKNRADIDANYYLTILKRNLTVKNSLKKLFKDKI